VLLVFVHLVLIIVIVVMMGRMMVVVLLLPQHQASVVVFLHCWKLIAALPTEINPMRVVWREYTPTIVITCLLALVLFGLVTPFFQRMPASRGVVANRRTLLP
jgi:hypothetical protein